MQGKRNAYQEALRIVRQYAGTDVNNAWLALLNERRERLTDELMHVPDEQLPAARQKAKAFDELIKDVSRKIPNRGDDG